MFSLIFVCLAILISANSFFIWNLYERGLSDGRKSPSDYFSSKDIMIGTDAYGSKYYVAIKIDRKPIVTEYEGTGSMKPTFGKNHNGIEIKPESEKELFIGDIISFFKDEQLIVHRIIDYNYDSEGWYAVTKGDNNKKTDGKVRFKDIHGKVIMIIY